MGGEDDSRGIKGSDWSTANRGLRDGVVGRVGAIPGVIALSQAAVSLLSNCMESSVDSKGSRFWVVVL